jgi:hypothetical protein
LLPIPPPTDPRVEEIDAPCSLPNPLLIIACEKGSSDDCAGTMTTEPWSHPHLILQSPQYSTPFQQCLCSSTWMHHGYTRTPTIESAPLMLLPSMWLNTSALVSSLLHAPSPLFFSQILLPTRLQARAQQLTRLLPHIPCLGQCGPCNSVRDLEFSGLEREYASSQCQFRLVVLVPNGIKNDILLV